MEEEEKEKQRQKYLLELQTRIFSLGEAIPKQLKVRSAEDVMYITKTILRSMAEDIERINSDM